MRLGGVLGWMKEMIFNLADGDRLWFIGGLIFFMAGVFGLVAPGFIPFLSAETEYKIPSGNLLGVMVGLTGGVYGTYLLWLRTFSNLETVLTPQKEKRKNQSSVDREVNIPGNRFDNRIENLSSGVWFRKSDKVVDNCRGELQGATVEILSSESGYSEDEAKNLVKKGEWTDDPYASSFLSGSKTGLSWFRIIRDMISENQASTYDLKIERTKREIMKIGDEEHEIGSRFSESGIGSSEKEGEKEDVATDEVGSEIGSEGKESSTKDGGSEVVEHE